MCGSTNVTSTTSPPQSVLNNYNDVTAQAKTVAATPYTPFSGQLVAGINQGQSDAIGQLQSGVGVANPYLNTGSSYLDSASGGLAAAQPYLQAGAQSVAQGQGYQQQAAGLAGPNAYQQYMNPYTQSVINATMGNLNANDAVQQQQLSSNAIGQGAFGGDRAGIAQADLARQQDLANNQTIAGLESQGYNTAVGQAQSAAGLYGNLANSANQSAGLYGTLGQTQGQLGSAYGSLAGQSGQLGNIAQSTAIQGASAALQGSTLQQQNQQQQDTAAYGQYLAGMQYPFQTTGWLANIDEGIGANSGSTSTTPGASTLSQVAGAATTGLGILGATGAFGSSGYLTGASGLLTSDERVKEDIEPIGKTYDGQTMYRYRYKGDPTMRTGLMAGEVERHTPEAVHFGLDGVKALDYGAATERAARRGHFARGGGLALARPHFLDGGDIGDPAQLGLGEAAPVSLPIMSFAPSGLTSGSPNVTGSPVSFTSSNQRPALAPAGLRSAGLGVLSAPPATASATPSVTSAPGAGLTAAGSPSGLNAGLGSNNQNLWNSVIAAGLGTMAGTSPYALANIGQGGLAGLNTYQNLQKADRDAAVSQADIDYKRGTLGIEQNKAALDVWGAQQIYNAHRAAAGLPTVDFQPPAALGLGAAPSPSSGSGVAAAAPPNGIAPTPLPAAQGANAPTTAMSPAEINNAAADLHRTATANAGQSTAQTGAAAGAVASGAMPSAASPSLAPDFDPQVLAARANAAQSYGDTAGADALRSRAAAIVSNGYGLDAGGNRVPLPGYLDNLSQQKSAEAQGEEAGKYQTVYAADGTPMQVAGDVYKQIVRRGGGQIDGMPVSTGASPYMKANVDNYTEFSKNAQAFIGDYPQQKYNLDSIAHIFQNYQAGRGAEAIADLDSYAKQAGIEDQLPVNWQNSASGFDAAVKVATTEAFTGLKDSGVTRAPATGLREVMLTTPRPDADPAALYKLVTDKQAALEYGHDAYTNFVNSSETNPTRSLMTFQQQHPYGGYVKAARGATAPFAGMTPAGGAVVLGPTGVQDSGAPGAPAPTRGATSSPANASQPVSLPAPAQRVTGQIYMTPKGPARWMGNGWQAGGN